MGGSTWWATSSRCPGGTPGEAAEGGPGAPPGGCVGGTPGDPAGSESRYWGPAKKWS